MHHLTFFLCEMIPTNLFTSCPIHYFVLISERLINTANSLDSVNMDQLSGSDFIQCTFSRENYSTDNVIFF